MLSKKVKKQEKTRNGRFRMNKKAVQDNLLLSRIGGLFRHYSMVQGVWIEIEPMEYKKQDKMIYSMAERQMYSSSF